MHIKHPKQIIDWYNDVLYKRFLPLFAMTFGTVAKWVWAIGASFPHDPEIIRDRPSWDTKWACVRSGEASKPNHFRRYVHPTRWIPEKHFRRYVYHTVNPRNTFPFLCTSHTFNPGKTFPFVCTCHTVLCIRSCVKGVTITHALPWLTICFYELHHTRFDIESCVDWAIHHKRFYCQNRLQSSMTVCSLFTSHTLFSF